MLKIPKKKKKMPKKILKKYILSQFWEKWITGLADWLDWLTDSAIGSLHQILAQLELFLTICHFSCIINENSVNNFFFLYIHYVHTPYPLPVPNISPFWQFFIFQNFRGTRGLKEIKGDRPPTGLMTSYKNVIIG